MIKKVIDIYKLSDIKQVNKIKKITKLYLLNIFKKIISRSRSKIQSKEHKVILFCQYKNIFSNHIGPNRSFYLEINSKMILQDFKVFNKIKTIKI